MKRIIKNNKILALGLIIGLLGSCESFELQGGQNDPNQQIPSNSDANLLLKNVQNDFASFYYEMSDDTRGLVRMVNQFGTYGVASDPQNTQTQWNLAYAGILRDIKAIKEISKSKDIPYHLAISKVIEAYTMVTLVDFFGDVPYTEATLGADNLNPKVDSGEVIYDKMISQLDEAIVLLGKTNNVPLDDFYYKGDTSKWVKLINSLKLKIYNNLRLTRDVSAQVNSIVASGKIMTSNSDDFNFNYAAVNSPTDSRHQDFIVNYNAAKAFHMSNSYLLLLSADKSANLGVDPRRRHYFYRQTTTPPSGVLLPCTGNPNIPICYIGGSFWGRDHADNTGIPADASKRTVVGLYPAGGKFDNSNNLAQVDTNPDKGAGGAGVLNILDYSFVEFILAELALKEAGVSVGTPATHLTNAVTQNIAKVRSFRPDLQGSNVATTAAVTNYINEVNSKYAGATTDDARLNIIIKEFFIALWGNGMEAYNAFRRTGMPLKNTGNIGMQSPVIGNSAGPFVRSFPYPKNVTDNNNNVLQHNSSKQVFWDNNPAQGFID